MLLTADSARLSACSVWFYFSGSAYPNPSIWFCLSVSVYPVHPLPSGNGSLVDFLNGLGQHAVKLTCCLVHIKALGQGPGKACYQARAAA